MIEIQAGEYECTKCKKLTIIPRKKKTGEPLICCDIEMVLKPKTKFTEPPAPKAPASGAGATKKRASSKAKTVKAKATRAASSKAKVEEEISQAALNLPLSPGNYMCPTCGIAKVLLATDDLDKWLRCPDCFVKMLPT